MGFRFTCQSVARGHQVAGFVRNLDDGRVELLVEGESEEVDQFLKAIHFELATYIHQVTTEPEPPGDDLLVGFSIRH